MTRMSLLRGLAVSSLFFAVSTGCVEEGPDHPGIRGLSQPADAAQTPDAGDAGAADRGTIDAARPDGESRFIVLNDTTMGLGVGLYFGSDLDAVTFECSNGRQGAGIAVSGTRQGNALELPVQGAIGVADGPCDPLEECAATTGAGGWLAVELIGLSSGCTVTVHEVADGGEDRFEVWLCETDTLNGDCAGPLVTGVDGEAVEGVVP